MSVPIAIANDIFDEDSELFRVEVTSNDPRAMISGSPADVTILDDDSKLALDSIFVKVY